MVNFERDPHGHRAPELIFRMVCGGPKLTTELYKTSTRQPSWWKGGNELEQLYAAPRHTGTAGLL